MKSSIMIEMRRITRQQGSSIAWKGRLYGRVDRPVGAVRRAILVSAFASSVLGTPAFCGPSLQIRNEADAELSIVAVHVREKPDQSWLGNGVYLGNGFVLTAAHVVSSSWFTKPTVEVAHLSLVGNIVREGSFSGDDLTLLKIDDTKLPMIVRLRHVQLCQTLPPLGSQVIVATPEGTRRSILFSPVVLSPRVRALYPTLIPDVASTGNSGSGVFEAGTQCLLGIMSRKLSSIVYQTKNGETTKSLRDIAKYFVPFSAIAKALPAWVAF